MDPPGVGVAAILFLDCPLQPASSRPRHARSMAEVMFDCKSKRWVRIDHRQCQNVAMSRAAVVRADGQAVDPTRLAEVCKRYGIVELAVFGSVSRGDAGPDSDVDLLYVLAPSTRLGFGIDDLEDELAELFDRDVDLVARKAVHPLLRDKVDELAKTLYAA